MRLVNVETVANEDDDLDLSLVNADVEIVDGKVRRITLRGHYGGGLKAIIEVGDSGLRILVPEPPKPEATEPTTTEEVVVS